MTLPFIAALFYFVLFTDHIFARALYGGAKVFLVVWPLAAFWFVLNQRMPWAELRPFGSWKAIGWGMATGLMIVGLMGGLFLTVMGPVVQGGAPEIQEKVEAMGIENYYWTYGLALSLFHSYLEEYYWRWFVFGRLRQVLPGAAAHLLAGICFSGHHIVVTTQYFSWGWGLFLGFMTGVGGVIWSWQYEKFNSLVGPWLSHILVDLGILAIGHKVLFGTWW
jgi:membrane protease YdiL (CAAX protease family)